MEPSEKQLSRLLRTLYEAAADPQHWPSFVEAMLHETGADCSFVIALGNDEAPALYSQVGFNEESLQNYQQYFYKHDLVLQRFRQAGCKHGSWIDSRNSVLPDAELEGSEFYNDYMRPMNQYHQAGANLGITGQYPLAGITLVRSRAAGVFSSEVISLLRAISPHLRQALLLHQKLSELKVEGAVYSRALETSGVACAAISDMGNLQSCNAAADALLRRSDGLLVVEGKLKAQDPRDDAALQDVVRRACQVGSGKGECLNRKHPPGGGLLIRRQHLEKPLQVAVMPFHSDGRMLNGKPAALVFIIDPDARTLSRADLLRGIYGLTPAEARMCDLLAQGSDVKKSAERLHITEASARFVLQRVFKKVSVKNQSALLRLILALPAVSLENGE